MGEGLTDLCFNFGIFSLSKLDLIGQEQEEWAQNNFQLDWNGSARLTESHHFSKAAGCSRVWGEYIDCYILALTRSFDRARNEII